MDIICREGADNKKNYILSLAAVLVFAFLVRLYSIGFPAIGYHNVKEHEMINIAKNMLKNGDYFSRYADFHYGLEANPKKIDIFPGGYITIWQTAVCLKLFGENAFLAPARTINILFFLAGIIFAFHIVVILTRSASLGLLTAFILSIIPEGIFFARNLQPESPAFAGMLACVYFYLRFTSSLDFRYLFFSSLAAVFVFICKLSFLICFLPLLFVIPYREFFNRYTAPELARNVFLAFLPFVVVVAVFWLGGELRLRVADGRIRLFEIFTLAYWDQYGVPILHYVLNENYTSFFVVFIILGYRFAIDCQSARYFVFGWTTALVIYCMIFSDFINQHCYYQMPFLFLAAFLSAVALESIGRGLNRFIAHLGTIVVVLFFVFSLPFLYISLWEDYTTIFPGMEDVGHYIRDHTRPGERFFLSSFCQQWGISTYADRKCGWVDTLGQFKEKEKIFNIRFIVFYPPFYYDNQIPGDIKKYIRDNYHIVYGGWCSYPDDKGYVEMAMILQKGGRIDPAVFAKGGRLVLKKEYRIFDWKVPYAVLAKDLK